MIPCHCNKQATAATAAVSSLPGLFLAPRVLDPGEKVFFFFCHETSNPQVPARKTRDTVVLFMSFFFLLYLIYFVILCIVARNGLAGVANDYN